MTHDFEKRLAGVKPRLLQDVKSEILQKIGAKNSAIVARDRSRREYRSYLTVGIGGFLLGLLVMYWVMTGFFHQSHPGEERLMARNRPVSGMYLLDEKTLDSLERPLDLMRCYRLPTPMEHPLPSQTEDTQQVLLRKMIMNVE